jgi:hypothetical protein
MKHIRSLYLLFLVTLAFSSCSDSNDEPVAEPGAPEWIAGYPTIPFGAISADLILQADKKSKVYWVIADKSISLTPIELREQAVSATNAAIKFKGVASIDPNTEKIQTVSNLVQNKKYFAYLVSESVADTVLQPAVRSFDFTTYYRQDTSSYLSTAESRTVLYLIYRPENALKYPDKKYPICFFLGGDGEVAAPGEINMIHGGTLPEYIKKGNDVDMMVMSIQQTVKNWNANLVEEGVTHGLATYPVNTKKVYMTGLSGGGYGVWNYSVAFPTKLTAIVPISGGGNKNKACNIKSISIWAFHNEVDGTVNVVNSQNMVNAVNACPPVEAAKLTLFPDTGHDCWRRVYDQNSPDWSKPGKNGIAKVDIYSWMLSKSK